MVPNWRIYIKNQKKFDFRCLENGPFGGEGGEGEDAAFIKKNGTFP